ncbi:uncharacterized protein FOMMEDRAFT_87510 [Fomitiporia mediterranea MF3/22]|uniref:uncharacterized protein n=1 Tax=Fomitiporia mediterranea (strain MF3/22) TaxID=694068 RepID=UPI00044090C1|nr:uncharacterized protein FOMMEDRAFT_87510 [Fomitiporia mediterranea MF3/22]EJD02451.1 hypothetical protein FOMMEDRAFT_87510 [Fomitiporia mediterranea MF3/22]
MRLHVPDEDLVKRTLSSPPFHSVEGVINFRDFGILSFPPDSAVCDEIPHIRSGFLFRSGELSRLTDKGKATLKKLGITTIFDLRSGSEIRKYQSTTPDVDGIRFVRVPVSENDEYDPMALASKFALSRFASDEKNEFAALYSDILAKAGPAYEKILIHLRDKPDEPFLVHCTGGKDRTGLFAALVQLLLGVPDAAIAHDYGLTTYGLAPAIPALIGRFQKEAVYRDNWEGFQNMGSAKKETMFATLDFIRERYGGAEGYIKARTSLTDADIAQIRRNLLQSSQSQPESEPSSPLVASHRSSDSTSTFGSVSYDTNSDVESVEAREEVPEAQRGRDHPVSSMMSNVSAWVAYASVALGFVLRAVL